MFPSEMTRTVLVYQRNPITRAFLRDEHQERIALRDLGEFTFSIPTRSEELRILGWRDRVGGPTRDTMGGDAFLMIQIDAYIKPSSKEDDKVCVVKAAPEWFTAENYDGCPPDWLFEIFDTFTSQREELWGNVEVGRVIQEPRPLTRRDLSLETAPPQTPPPPPETSEPEVSEPEAAETVQKAEGGLPLKTETSPSSSPSTEQPAAQALKPTPEAKLRTPQPRSGQ